MTVVRTFTYCLSIMTVSILACVASGRAAADEPAQLPVKSKWTGTLTQRGKHPRIPRLPPKFDVIFTVTKRDGNKFEAEMFEQAGEFKVTYLVKGEISQPSADSKTTITFRSVSSKNASGNFVAVKQVPFAGTITKTKISGTWKYPKNDHGITLNGTFDYKRE